MQKPGLTVKLHHFCSPGCCCHACQLNANVLLTVLHMSARSACCPLGDQKPDHGHVLQVRHEACIEAEILYCLDGRASYIAFIVCTAAAAKM